MAAGGELSIALAERPLWSSVLSHAYMVMPFKVGRDWERQKPRHPGEKAQALVPYSLKSLQSTSPEPVPQVLMSARPP